MLVHENKKAYFEYQIEEFFVAGIKLEGWEVKAIRKKQVSLVASYALIQDSIVRVIGMKVDPLKAASSHVTPEPERTRELLLRKDEIKTLIGKIAEKGYTLIPLNVHMAHGLVKLKLGLARGKKLHDKRETIMARDAERDASRQIKDLKNDNRN